MSDDDRKYNFEMIFSGLCLFHLPPKPNHSGFDPAVLLINAVEPRTSIDRKTHLHRHVPTLTFNPGDLDDFSIDVGTFDSHFSLIPRGGRTAAEDTMGVVDLEETLITIETHPDDRKPFVAKWREAPRQEPDPDEDQYDENQYYKNDLCWLPGLSAIDRRIRGLKRQCFASVVKNRFVTARVQLDQGKLISSRLPAKEKETKRDTRAAEEFLLWEFYPNRFPGRGRPYQDKGQEDQDRPYYSLHQALADQLTLKLCNLKHPIRLRFDGRRRGSLVFPKNIKDTQVVEEMTKVTVNVGNLPTLPELPDTEVVTHFRWFYELVEWNSGLPTDLPAPRPERGAIRGAVGGSFLCPSTGNG